MKNEFDQRKQKFKDKSDFIALNSQFKIVKNSLDDVKDLMSEHDESMIIQEKMQECQKQLDEAHGNFLI